MEDTPAPARPPHTKTRPPTAPPTAPRVSLEGAGTRAPQRPPPARLTRLSTLSSSPPTSQEREEACNV